MLSSILAPLAEGGKSNWPPLGVDPALTLWYEAVGRIRGQLMHWMDKQSKHIAVSRPFNFYFRMELKFFPFIMDMYACNCHQMIFFCEALSYLQRS